MRMDDQPEASEQIAETNHTEDSIDIDSRGFEKIVRSRRSTRVYTDEKVPESVIRSCLDLAVLAPNSSNLQPWEFYWVRDPAKKRKLADYCLSQPAATTAQELIVCVARLDTWRRNRALMVQQLESSNLVVPDSVFEYYNRIVPLAYNQGPLNLFGPFKRIMLWLMAIRRPMPRGPASKADMRVWAHKSTALACENLMLALRAHGYDSCPMEGMDETRIRKMLNLPRLAEICMVISAGKRADSGIYGQRIRFDKSMFIFEVQA